MFDLGVAGLPILPAACRIPTIRPLPRSGARQQQGKRLDLKLPIVIFDELSESVIESTGVLDLASGDISTVEYKNYDRDTRGLPAEDEDYEFTSGLLRSRDREVEFRVEVDVMSGRYSVTPSELLELKGRAARLFTQAPDAPQVAVPPAKRSGKPRE